MGLGYERAGTEFLDKIERRELGRFHANPKQSGSDNGG